MNYEEFLISKSVIDPDTGLTSIPALNPMLYPHQSDMVKWALRRGRAALFADCGIGKGPMQMEWADKQPHECIIAARSPRIAGLRWRSTWRRRWRGKLLRMA